MAEKIGVPSVGGIKSAVGNAAVGAAGGMLFGLSQRMFGTGLWGGLAGIALAGSVVKGSAGEAISTILGFQIGEQLVSGISAGKPVSEVAGGSFTLI